MCQYTSYKKCVYGLMRAVHGRVQATCIFQHYENEVAQFVADARMTVI